MTSPRTWKNLESKAAAILGGTRAGVTGLETPDVYHPLFEIECKLRAALAFVPWFKQAEKHAKKSGKVPLLICKLKGHPGEYAVLRLADFAELLEEKQSKPELT